MSVTQGGTSTRDAEPPPGAAPQIPAIGAAVVVLALTAAVVAATLPGLPSGDGSMVMTHYMELLNTNQPWNLLMFMAAPVALAETLAITELAILFNRDTAPWIRTVNRWAGLIAGIYFLGVFAYLFRHVVVPLTSDSGWRGPADVIAVLSYLAGVVPLFGIALLEMGVLGRRLNANARLKLHAAFVGLFLIVAHVAMILGMLDPTILGYDSGAHMHM